MYLEENSELFHKIFEEYKNLYEKSDLLDPNSDVLSNFLNDLEVNEESSVNIINVLKHIIYLNRTLLSEAMQCVDLYKVFLDALTKNQEDLFKGLIEEWEEDPVKFPANKDIVEYVYKMSGNIACDEN